jgi:hypothetical protein
MVAGDGIKPSAASDYEPERGTSTKPARKVDKPLHGWRGMNKTRLAITYPKNWCRSLDSNQQLPSLELGASTNWARTAKHTSPSGAP